MVHFNGLNFSCQIHWSERNNHARFNSTGFNTTNRDRSNTTNFVNVLEWKTKWLIRRTRRRLNGINSIDKSLTSCLAGFRFNVPTFEPRHLVRTLQHVITMPPRNWNKSNSVRIVANFLQVATYFLNNFWVTGVI
eukprot:Pompholyxophrys_punicea_v1_NODE_1638_length_610_cov_16.567568.p2 type:complete len:135 gc:universal NODE_1638_length_610_cov_16.567568:495-91(-)